MIQTIRLLDSKGGREAMSQSSNRRGNDSDKMTGLPMRRAFLSRNPLTGEAMIQTDAFFGP